MESPEKHSYAAVRLLKVCRHTYSISELIKLTVVVLFSSIALLAKRLEIILLIGPTPRLR